MGRRQESGAVDTDNQQRQVSGPRGAENNEDAPAESWTAKAKKLFTKSNLCKAAAGVATVAGLGGAYYMNSDSSKSDTASNMSMPTGKTIAAGVAGLTALTGAAYLIKRKLSKSKPSEVSKGDEDADVSDDTSSKRSAETS